MKEERYRYNRKCEYKKCSKPFKSDKASTMFCCTSCAEEYFEDKYKKDENKN